jgi:hypothetical protein
MSFIEKSVFVATTLSILLVGTFAQATTVAVDFANYPVGTAFTNQIPGVTFGLMGGPGSHGAPVIDDWGSNGLSNSDTGDYPTAAILDVSFAGLASKVTFNFDNYDHEDAGTGATFFSAFDSAGTLLETGRIGDGGFFELVSTGIADLQFNNNSGGIDSWLFDLKTLNADVSAVPEPATSTMLLAGLGLVGFMTRRKFGQKAT